MRLAAAVLLLLAANAFGQTLDQLNKQDQLDRAMSAIERLETLVKERAARTSTACMKAIGAKTFCSCIADNLPVRFDFSEYVAITTRSKEDNRYASLDPETRKGYDLVPAVREQCVKAARSPAPAGQ
jgi:hypothetical protein